MTTEYWESDELKELAEDLIANHHPHFAGARIAYLFRDKAQCKALTLNKEVTQVTPGHFQKMGKGKYEILTGKDLVMEFGHDVWQEYSPAQRRYWVDTLLSTMAGEEDEKSGEMQYWSVPYTVSVFPDVVLRHGLVMDELRDCYRIMRSAHEKEQRDTQQTVLIKEPTE